MPKAYSVFIQSIHNVSAHHLHQHMIKICCKMIQLPFNQRVKQIITCRQQKGLSVWHDVGQL